MPLLEQGRPRSWQGFGPAHLCRRNLALSQPPPPIYPSHPSHGPGGDQAPRVRRGTLFVLRHQGGARRVRGCAGPPPGAAGAERTPRPSAGTKPVPKERRRQAGSLWRLRDPRGGPGAGRLFRSRPVVGQGSRGPIAPARLVLSSGRARWFVPSPCLESPGRPRPSHLRDQWRAWVPWKPGGSRTKAASRSPSPGFSKEHLPNTKHQREMAIL